MPFGEIPLKILSRSFILSQDAVFFNAAWIAIFSVPSRFRQKYNSEPTYNDCKQRFQLLAVIFLRPKETSYGDEV